MRSLFRSLILSVAFGATMVGSAGAQGTQALLDEVMALTPRALRDLVTVAESGDTTAQVKVGLAYYFGYAVPAMPEEAARWFRRAAERDCAAAQHMLGVQYRDGAGVDPDANEALRLLSTAAERGYPDAQYDYGLMLFDGNGVSQDHAEAYRWFSKAAEQGSVGGQTFVGIMLVNGLGVPPDLPAGREALLEAAKAGSIMAQANLGALYANGVGVTQSNREALVWFYMAEAGGFEGVSQYIADMTQAMAESDVTDIRREAQERTQRFLDESSGSAVENAAASMTEEEASAVLDSLTPWLIDKVEEFGTFSVSVIRDIARANSEDEQVVSFRGKNTITDVTMEGCRLHYLEVTRLDPRVEETRWEWFVDLAIIDLSALSIRTWEVPSGWRMQSGQRFDVYLMTARDADHYFFGVAPDGREVITWELGLSVDSRANGALMIEKLREAQKVCRVVGE